MGEKPQVEDGKKGLEKVLLFCLTLHILFMFLGGVYYKWSIWSTFFMFLIGISNWIIYLIKNWNFEGRAYYTVLMTQVCTIIYSMNSKDILGIGLPFAAMVVIVGFYAIEDLFFIMLGSYTFIVVYNMFIVHSFELKVVDDIYTYLVPIVNTYFIVYWIRFWVRKRNKNEKSIFKVITDLKRAEHSKDDFLANVSHEIRTPINTISGMSEVLLREQLSDDVRDKVLDIQTSGRKLLAVVNDLLDFSELASGKQKIVEAPYNITSTINDVINMANAWKDGKDIEIIVDCDANIPKSLIGDEQKIRRVILSFISNAIKFTNEGCISIVIATRPEYYGINLSVTVKDTGIGMDNFSREKLFTSFNQVDTKRNRQEGGVGLGLAISQAIIEQMGGSISVRSEIGKGSEFQFVIPQKVDDKEPLIFLENANRINILLYINMEQFDMRIIRDEYVKVMMNIGKQLNVRFHICRNLAEFKRRVERDYFTDYFISWGEYLEDTKYFDDLSSRAKVVIIIDDTHEKEIRNSKLVRLYKPFYILPVVSILKGNNAIRKFGSGITNNNQFIAPYANILLVDDNLINLKVASSLLKPYKVNITTAISGAEALDKIESKEFDLVFMDHMMPEMDGVEALHRIRKKNGLYFKEVPVIALTANAVAGAREMFLAEGFQEFVSKPIELSALHRVLRDFIPDDKKQAVEEEKSEKEADTQENTSDSKNVVAEKAPEETRSEEPAAKTDSFFTGSKSNASQGANKLGLDFGEVNVDVSQGVMYCGSEEDYVEILKLQYEDGEENKGKIQRFFDEKDWKNYTILVHGLKSSMKSVGIMELSEMAKDLEMAGKSGDEPFILTNHQAMMDEYVRVLRMLKDNFGDDSEDEEDLSDIPVLEKEDFDNRVKEFEDAVYTWEAENMDKIISELKGYQYGGKALSEVLEPIEKKIAMSDYMSALDALSKAKSKLEG